MGKKSKKSKKAKQPCSVLLWHKTFIKRIRQLWSEQIPNAVDQLRQRSANWLRPGIPGSSLNGLHPEARGEIVERRMRVTGESQAVATANVMAAFEKLSKDKE